MLMSRAGGGGVGGGSKFPASHILCSRFPPLCTFPIVKYYAMLQNPFPVSLGSRPLGNPTSHPLFSRLL